MQTLLENVPVRKVWYLEALAAPIQFELRGNVLFKTMWHPQYADGPRDIEIGYALEPEFVDDLRLNGVEQKGMR